MAKDKRNFGNTKRGRFLEKINEFFKKHWFFYTIIISTPSIIFTILLPYFGVTLHLTKEDNGIISFTKFGLISTTFLIIFVVIITFLNNLYLSRTEKSKLQELESEKLYQSEIIQNIDKICKEKFLSLKKVIQQEKTTDKERATIISNPSNQLNRIISGMTECLIKLLAKNESLFSFNELLVTIAYSFPQETDNNWKWVDGGGETDMELSELLDPQCKSTFNYLLNNHTNTLYYFNNSKEDARKNKRYAYTSQDDVSAEQNEPVGSIFCSRHQVKQDGVLYIDAMISITTQRKRFATPKKVRTVRENMRTLVDDCFAKRIGIELSLLYLEYLKNQELINKSNINNQQPNL